MKRVSFPVAKALKEAGYPQELKEGTIFYAENGLMDKYDSDLYELFDPMYCVCPYTMEVWLWLWREKKISIDVDYLHGIFWGTFTFGEYVKNDDGEPEHADPEDAIVSAIEYLVKNNLIK